MKEYLEQHVLTSVVWSLVLVAVLGGTIGYFPGFPSWLLLLAFLFGQILLGGLTNPAMATRYIGTRIADLACLRGAPTEELPKRAQRLDELRCLCGEIAKEDTERQMVWIEYQSLAANAQRNAGRLIELRSDEEPASSFNERLKTIGDWCHARADGTHNQQTTASMLHQKAAKLAGKTYKPNDKHHS